MYIPWDAQTTVAQEGFNIKKDPCWKVAADGVMKYCELVGDASKPIAALDRSLARSVIAKEGANL